MTYPPHTDRLAPPPPARDTDASSADGAAAEPEGVKVYGVAACRALWRARPEDVLRVFVHEDQVPQFKDLLKAFAQRRRPYHVVGDEDLRRLTDTVHHGGVCLVAKPKRTQTLEGLLVSLQSQPVASLVLLDGVENPHNVGAILRTCAHFGARAVLVDARQLDSLPASAARVAVGGAEAVALVPVDDPVAAIQRLAEVGFKAVTTDMRGGQDLYQGLLPKRVLFLLGAETTGVSAPLRAAAHGVLSIPGTGKVESLNVSCAASVLLAEFWRQRPPRTKPTDAAPKPGAKPGAKPAAAPKPSAPRSAAPADAAPKPKAAKPRAPLPARRSPKPPPSE